MAFLLTLALVQLRRQTVVGWCLLLAGFAVVAIGLCYLTFNELFGPWPLALLAAAIAICVGVVLCRPTRSR